KNFALRRSGTSQLSRTENLELRTLIGIHHDGRLRTCQNDRCSHKSRVALSDAALIDVGAGIRVAHASSVAAADAPEDILTGEIHRGRRVAECAGGNKGNVAIREIPRICRRGTQTHTLELAVAPACAGEKQQKASRHPSKPLHKNSNYPG